MQCVYKDVNPQKKKEETVYHHTIYQYRPPSACMPKRYDRVLVLLPSIPDFHNGSDHRLLQVMRYFNTHMKTRVSLAYFEDSVKKLRTLQADNDIAESKLISKIRSHVALDYVLGPLGAQGIEGLAQTYDLVLYWVWPNPGYLDMILRSVRYLQILKSATRVIAFVDDETQSFRVISPSFSSLKERHRIENVILSIRPSRLLSKKDSVNMPKSVSISSITPSWRRLITQELECYHLADMIVTKSKKDARFVGRFIPGKKLGLLPDIQTNDKVSELNQIILQLETDYLRVLIDGNANSDLSLHSQNLGIALTLQNQTGVNVSQCGDREKGSGIKTPHYKNLDDIPSGMDYHVLIRQKWPPDLSSPSPRLCGTRCRMVLFLPWEFGYLPVDWIEPINRIYDEVWAESRWNARQIIDSGVRSQSVHVVPCGIDCRNLKSSSHSSKRKPEKGSAFTFLYQGAFMPRKGVDLTIHAFDDAFSNEGNSSNGQNGRTAKLVVHTTYQLGFSNEETKQMERIINKNSKRIEWIRNKFLPRHEYLSLLINSDVFVMPSRSEGFGVPMVEAMSFGVPVVTISQGTSSDDFTREDFAYLVPGTMTPCLRYPCTKSGQLCTFCTGGVCKCLTTVKQPRWVEIKVKDLSKILTKIFNNPKDARARGQRAKRFVLDNYCWEKLGPVYLERILSLSKSSASNHGNVQFK